MRALLLTIAIVLAFTASGVAQEDRKVYTKEDGVVLPVMTKDVKPQYTPGAMQARVQGSVFLTCVVETDGGISDVRVKKPLHAELDQEAVKALKQWRFKPGTKDDKPVRVQVEIEMTFTLRDPPKG
jgi:TonB family protein